MDAQPLESTQIPKSQNSQIGNTSGPTHFRQGMLHLYLTFHGQLSINSPSAVLPTDEGGSLRGTPGLCYLAPRGPSVPGCPLEPHPPHAPLQNTSRITPTVAGAPNAVKDHWKAKVKRCPKPSLPPSTLQHPPPTPSHKVENNHEDFTLTNNTQVSATGGFAL